MKKLEIMLVCGNGMSSGFLAQAMRKSAKKQDVQMNIFARSEAEIQQNIKKIDALLVSPHCHALMTNDHIVDLCRTNQVTMMLIEEKDYGYIDGEAVVQKLLKKMEGEKHEQNI